MTTGEIYDWIQSELKSCYDEREAASVADLLLESRLGLSRIDRILRRKNEISAKEEAQLKADTLALKENRPVQYVLGEAWFDGLLFRVNEDVLIPRPETEELVHWIAEENAKQSTRIMDIGTGSGCIPIALKRRLPGATLDAVDVSEGALAVASENAQRLQAPVTFHRVDFLDESAWPGLPRVDILVSNPPYIAEGEKTGMHARVLSQEPHLALFVPDRDPLIFYRKLARFAVTCMKPGSRIYLEINEALGKETAALLEEERLVNIVLRKDMQQKDRMIRAETSA